MATVGIMHSGSREIGEDDINALIARLPKDSPIDGPHWGRPQETAQSLIEDKNVDVLIAAGGSRSAQTAIRARGNRKKPIIVFTSVAPHLLQHLDRTITTGVCAHTSDSDGKRLWWLRKMPFRGNKIGVLRNSNRTDQVEQMDKLNRAAHDNHCILHPRDINGPITIADAFDWFRSKIDALLVAADPFFNRHREEVVRRANADNYPAIYQWREFVEIGGLMSYGPNLKNLYERAGEMAADILNGTTNPIPDVWEARDPEDFELVVKESTAKGLGMWPLPQEVADEAEVIL